MDNVNSGCEHRYVAEAGDAGERLDIWLVRMLPELSRSRIQALIKEGAVLAEGMALSPRTRVRAGLAVQVNIPPPKVVSVQPEELALEVLYEDEDIIVINKAAGMVVHPAPGHPGGTLVNALLHHCDDLAGVGGELRPGIVHRLDRDTSGVLIAAKRDDAMVALAKQFRNRDVEKTYLAIVHGRPPRRGDCIETMMGRSRHDRKKMTAHADRGRSAVTRYEVVASVAMVSLLRVRIFTGRTHQIRVHLAHVGCPVVGDRQYGRAGLDRSLPTLPGRQMLHAWRLGIHHPRGGRMLYFEAAMPPDMLAVLAALDIRGGFPDNPTPIGDHTCP